MTNIQVYDGDGEEPGIKRPPLPKDVSKMVKGLKPRKMKVKHTVDAQKNLRSYNDVDITVELEVDIIKDLNNV